MTKKVISIDRCFVCPYCLEEQKAIPGERWTVEIVFHCQKRQARLPDVNVIPDFCPLPDADSSITNPTPDGGNL